MGRELPMTFLWIFVKPCNSKKEIWHFKPILSFWIKSRIRCQGTLSVLTRNALLSFSEKQDHFPKGELRHCRGRDYNATSRPPRSFEAIMIDVLFTLSFLQWSLKFPELSSSCIGAVYNLEGCRYFDSNTCTSWQNPFFFCSGVEQVGKRVCTECKDVGEEWVAFLKK